MSSVKTVDAYSPPAKVLAISGDSAAAPPPSANKLAPKVSPASPPVAAPPAAQAPTCPQLTHPQFPPLCVS